VLAGPTIRRRRLGIDLRRLREARSLKLEEVAVHLGVAPSTLSRIETGKAPTRTSYLVVMLDLYGVTDASQRALLADLAREGQRRGWWWEYEDLLPAGSGNYLGLEAEACTLRAFEVQLIPDLLQTPDYARAVIAAGRPELPALQAERLVGVQMRRQEVLTGQDPLRLRLILDESALLRSVGPSGMMRQQLTRLAELAAAASADSQRDSTADSEAGAAVGSAARVGVTIQVLPLAAAERLVLTGSFGILSFAEPKDADVLCAAGLRGQVLLEEREADVNAMRLMFDALSLSALPPAASAELIGDLAARA
jgi:transcriptional regulator with XRE-family HTH domain